MGSGSTARASCRRCSTRCRTTGRRPPAGGEGDAHRLWPSLYVYVSQRLRGLRAERPLTPAGRGRRSRSAAGGRGFRGALEGRAPRRGDALRPTPEVEAALAEAPPATIASLRPVLTGHYRYDAIEQLPMLRLSAFVQPRAMADMLTLPPATTTPGRRRPGCSVASTSSRAAPARGRCSRSCPAAVQVSPEAWRSARASASRDEAALTDDDASASGSVRSARGRGSPSSTSCRRCARWRDEALYIRSTDTGPRSGTRSPPRCSPRAIAAG